MTFSGLKRTLQGQKMVQIETTMTFYSDYAMIGVWDRSRLMLSVHPYLGLYSLLLYYAPGKFFFALSKVFSHVTATPIPALIPRKPPFRG